MQKEKEPIEPPRFTVPVRITAGFTAAALTAGAISAPHICGSYARLEKYACAPDVVEQQHIDEDGGSTTNSVYAGTAPAVTSATASSFSADDLARFISTLRST